MSTLRRYPLATVGAVFGAVLLIRLVTIYPAPDVSAKLGWFVCFVAAIIVFGALGVIADYHRRRRQAERREDVATLERAESVLTALDDAPPPLPPAIPVSMRDPAFQQKLIVTSPRGACAICGKATKRAFCSDRCQIKAYAGVHREVYRKPTPSPLIAERRFTLLTHCPQGHVATHWLGATTDDHIERICRFEQCAATWLEKR